MRRITFPLIAIAAVFAVMNIAAGCSNTKKYNKPQLLRWDFAESGTRNYRFSQTSESTSQMSMMSPEGMPMADTSRYRTVAKGDLRIVASGGGKANMLLEGLGITAYQLDLVSGAPMDSMKEELEPITVENMGENGKPDSTDQLSQQLFDYLFTLPTIELAPGQSEETDLRIPFNTMGMPLMVGGKSKLTFTEVTKHQGRICAKLDTELLIDQLEIQEGMEGEYAFRRQGTSTFYFDLEKREFVSGVVTIKGNILLDAGPSFGRMSVESEDSFTLELAE